MTPGDNVCGCEPGDGAAGGGERGGGGPRAGEHGHEDQEVQVRRQHRHLYGIVTSYFAVHKITRPRVRWWEAGYWRERSSLQGEVIIVAHNGVQAEGQCMVTLSQHVRFFSHLIGQGPPNTDQDK